MASRDRRSEREKRARRARRLWRTYTPPESDQVRPESGNVDAKGHYSGWQTYRRKQPKLPTVPTVPADQTVAKVGQAWTPPDQVTVKPTRLKARNPYDADEGKKIVANGVVQIAVVTAIIAGAVGYGVLDGKRDAREREAERTSQSAAQEPPAYDGVDPRSVEGQAALVRVLVDQRGSSRINSALLDAESGVVEGVGENGIQVSYYWEGDEQMLDVLHASPTKGVEFDLAKIDPALYAPLLERVRDRLDLPVDAADVTIENVPGSKVWFRVTAAGETETGVLLADRRGRVLSEKYEPY